MAANKAHRLLESEEVPKEPAAIEQPIEEAVSLDNLCQQVAEAFRAKFSGGENIGGIEPFGWDVEIFPEACVSKKRGRFYRVPYKVESGEVVFDGTPQEVEVEFKPVPAPATAPAQVSESVAEVLKESAFTGRLLEAKDPEGLIWGVTIIQAGKTKDHYLPNGTKYVREYLGETISAAAPLFEGAKVFAFSGREHALSPGAKGTRDQVGYLKNPKMVGKDLQADLYLFKDAEWLRERLIGLKEAGDLEQIGLSIDADGNGQWVNEGATPVFKVTEITRVFSVDVVHSPAAGGAFNRLVASQISEDFTMNLEAILAILKDKRPDLLEGKDVAKITMEQAQAMLKEAMEKPKAADPPPPAPAPAPAAVKVTEAASPAFDPSKLQESFVAMQRQMQLMECSALLSSRLGESKLPEPVKNKIRKQFAGKVFEAAALEESLTTEAETLQAIFQQYPKSYGGDVKVSQDEQDKKCRALEAMFWDGPRDSTHPNLPEHLKGVTPYRSFTRAYMDITGNRDADARQILGESGGFIPGGNRLQESATTSSWTQLLSDYISKRMQAEYALPAFQDWRKIVSDISTVSNFQTQRRMKMGGYGVLSTVTEQGTYQSLTTPTDTEETYSVAKRGGLEDITFEMVKNDDVGAIRRIPQKLGRAAGQTLYREVFDRIEDNDALADAIALVNASHSNILSTAGLTNDNLSLAHEYMADQASYGDTYEILGLQPRYLIVPNELAEEAWQITRPWAVGQGELDTGNRNANYHSSYGLEPLVVGYFAVATDWWVVTDPGSCPTFEVGFLDGRQEPELFVQDQPNVGSVFTADKITYKIRFIFGVTTLDYRGVVGYIA